MSFRYTYNIVHYSKVQCSIKIFTIHIFNTLNENMIYVIFMIGFEQSPHHHCPQPRLTSPALDQSTDVQDTAVP